MDRLISCGINMDRTNTLPVGEILRAFFVSFL